MTISEMKKILKDMKEICDFKESETNIKVDSYGVPTPYVAGVVERSGEVSIKTQINGIDVRMRKGIEE